MFMPARVLTGCVLGNAIQQNKIIHNATVNLHAHLPPEKLTNIVIQQCPFHAHNTSLWCQRFALLSFIMHVFTTPVLSCGSSIHEYNQCWEGMVTAVGLCVPSYKENKSMS